MTTAFVFPGQGSQKIGMGKALFDASAAARSVFEEVDDALSSRLSGLIFEGNEDELRLTENAQPAIMTVSLAAVAAVKEATGKEVADLASHVAGHSLGEYSALAAAGALGVGQTAQLVRLRGKAMQQAVAVGEGAMAALLGLGAEAVDSVTDEASAAGGICVTANDNSDGQIVISGSKTAVERAVDLAKDKGARRAVMLEVSAPFHCSLMQPAADAMHEALADTSINAPAVPVIANVTAAPVQDADAIRALLVQQVTGQVRWRESVLVLAKLGVQRQVELGPGSVLTGLVRRIDRSLSAEAVGDPDAVQALAGSL
ncbi:MAG: ACP S-malonyltransferase [Pseudomonadota bacterium]